MTNNEKYMKDIITELEENETVLEIRPSQDFVDGSMMYTLKNNEDYYLVSGQGIMRQQDLPNYKMKNIEAQTICNFRKQSAVAFLKGSRVDSLDIFSRISNHLRKYIVFEDDRLYSVLTLWTIGTYIYRIFRYYPYIWLNADKGSGKSRVMEVVSLLAFNSVLAVNQTEASIFRIVDVDGATLFIDEFEKMRKENQQGIIQLLNSGFNVATGLVPRTEKVGNTFKPVMYSSYSPKMFAGISDISDVLMDRCIKIKMFKKPSDVVVQRFKTDSVTMEAVRSIQDELYIFGLQNGAGIKELYDSNTVQLPQELSDRECDIWEVLFTLAQFIDADNSLSLVETVKTYAVESSKERSNANIEQNISYKMIAVLVQIIPSLKPVKEDKDGSYYNSDEVFECFKDTEEFSWLNSKNYLTTNFKNRLHIDVKRFVIDGNKMRAYYFPKNHLSELVKRYNLKEVIEIDNLQ